MKRRLCLLLLLVSASVSLCFISSTYSRYVAGTEGNIDMLFAKWQILVNENDITAQNSSNITFNPVIEPSQNIKDNTIAPTSKGYFDIDIDPSNVEVSFRYLITLSMDNEDMPDLMITKYAYLPSNYQDGDALEYITTNTSTITDDLIYDNNGDGFEAFTIRVFFEWYDGEDETMNDVADSEVGETAALNDTTLTINATLSFEQIVDAPQTIANNIVPSEENIPENGEQN